jgi:hypothetical protein
MYPDNLQAPLSFVVRRNRQTLCRPLVRLSLEALIAVRILLCLTILTIVCSARQMESV